jgi:hypothetical protein
MQLPLQFLPRLSPFFANFGFNRDKGSCHRSTVGLNEHVRTLGMGTLTLLYSQKAMFLKGVAHNAALYLPVTVAHMEPAVFALLRVEGDPEQLRLPLLIQKREMAGAYTSGMSMAKNKATP